MAKGKIFSRNSRETGKRRRLVVSLSFYIFYDFLRIRTVFARSFFIVFVTSPLRIVAPYILAREFTPRVGLPAKKPFLSIRVLVIARLSGNLSLRLSTYARILFRDVFSFIILVAEKRIHRGKIFSQTFLSPLYDDG